MCVLTDDSERMKRINQSNQSNQMETIINDVLRMDTGTQVIVGVWALCVLSFYGTLIYGVGMTVAELFANRKKSLA